MNGWQFILILLSTLIGGPVVYWLLANKNENAVWSGSLSLILDDNTLVPITRHGTVILSSRDSVINGFILHGVPVGRIPFICVHSTSLELVEPIIARGQNTYHDVANQGDVKFRFTRSVCVQYEFELRFTTDRKLHNTLGFLKQAHSYDGGVYYESFVTIKWPRHCTAPMTVQS